MSNFYFGILCLGVSFAVSTVIRIVMFKLNPSAKRLAEEGEHVEARFEWIALIPFIFGIVYLFKSSIWAGILGLILSALAYMILGGLIIHLCIRND